MERGNASMTWRCFFPRALVSVPQGLAHGLSVVRHCPIPLQPRCGISSGPAVTVERKSVVGSRCAGDNYSSNVSDGAEVILGGGASSEGWCYEEVDAVSGRTPLDVLYEQRLQRIKAVFESPLPPLPRDGSVNPDLFVGFSHYDYRLRDQYRAVVAQGLQLPVAAVRLSVAWSGRFDVSRFNGVQKVCGVCVDLDAGDSEGGTMCTAEAGPEKCRAGDKNSCEGCARRRKEEKEKLQNRIGVFVRSANRRQSATLLRFQITKAAEAAPEVEFTAGEPELVAVERTQQWLWERILKPHLVVVIYGTNPNTRRKTPSTVNAERKIMYHSSMQSQRDDDLEQQRLFIERRWLKAFAQRRIVPCVISLDELTTMVCTAVQNGEVGEGFTAFRRKRMGVVEPSEEMACPFPSSGSGEGIAGATECTPPGELQSLFKPPLNGFDSWKSFVRKVLFRGHEERAVFPAFFVHGEWAGGAEEMRYLLHNREAMNALLLHPNDVAFKKKYVSRLRSSHSRLRMTEEMSG